MFRHGGRPVIGNVHQQNTALFRRLGVQVVARRGPGGDQPDFGVSPEEVSPDPRVDEHRNDLRIGRHIVQFIDELDLVAVQTVGEERLLVVLRFDKNNFHR